MARRKDRGAPALILPGYKDAEEIGGGAFATVYRAVEVDTGRPVALKILKIESVHPRLIETFAQETQALAQVSDHPNIVTLYRPLSTPDGRPVLVLELCRESLAQRVRRSGSLPAREVTNIAIKIAGALETAHRRGFLHRDMKPQNILVTQFGEPALGDFGVAALQASAQETAGVFGFTTLHAAPEMLEGQPLSAAADIYGLASTMYQLLTGSAPFVAFDNEAPASVILRIIRDPVRPLRADDIPLALSDLLEAALSKDPDQRPRSAADFADALVAVEAAAGWPPTSYVAWDRAGSAPGAVSPAPGDRPLLAPADQPPPAATLAPPAHARREVQIFAPPRWVAPPPPPPAAAAPPPPAAAAAPPPSAAAPPETPPLLPLAGAPLPPAQHGPSVAIPMPAPRLVVMPDRAEGGPKRPDPPTVTGAQPLPSRPPLSDRIDTGTRTAQPVFVDPPEPSDFPARAASAPPLRPESVYEQTILPSVGKSSRPANEGVAADQGRPLLTPLLIGGMAAAALVVVAALLLAFGVL